MRSELIAVVLGVMVLTGCSTGMKRTVIDESPNMPSWTEETKLSWEDGDYLYFKAKQTVRGDQRVNACYTLASLNNKETMLKGIADNVKGTLDHSDLDASENAELVLGKAVSSEWKGRVVGMKDEEQVFQRYVVGGDNQKTERIDCFVLSQISKADYSKVKQSVVDEVAKADPRIKDAIVKKQVNFFNSDRKAASE